VVYSSGGPPDPTVEADDDAECLSCMCLPALPPSLNSSSHTTNQACLENFFLSHTLKKFRFGSEVDTISPHGVFVVFAPVQKNYHILATAEDC
jgi:hypothetical protein